MSLLQTLFSSINLIQHSTLQSYHLTLTLTLTINHSFSLVLLFSPLTSSLFSPSFLSISFLSFLFTIGTTIGCGSVSTSLGCHFVETRLLISTSTA